MILDILVVVLPVFLITGAGYAAARFGLFPPAAVDGLMLFTQSFAIPALLFRAISELDLGAVFDPALLASYYIGAASAFTLGIIGARRIFGRRPGEAVAVGFCALFSNLVLLGLPITERAFGAEALAPTFAIISIHAPFCYLLGITVMEFARADGRGLFATGRVVMHAMFQNALMIGLALGFAVNLSGFDLPEAVATSLDMLAAAGLPAALFGLGGVLTRYTFRASFAEAGMTALLSLVIHPAITFLMAAVIFDLSDAFVRAAVLAAAMAPGVNTYVFASMYGRAQGVAASGVLLGTALSVLSVSAWIAVLGGVG